MEENEFKKKWKEELSPLPLEKQDAFEQLKKLLEEYYEGEIKKVNDQRDEYLAGWQRAKADFINYKKEEMKKLEDLARYGNEDLIKDFISVMDNFDLALRTLEKAGPVEKGIYLIRTQIDDILKKRGLTKIDLKPGDTFDPTIAEALSEVDAEQPPGTIVQEIEPGYRLHEKVLRPARVIVSKDKQE